MSSRRLLAAFALGALLPILVMWWWRREPAQPPGPPQVTSSPTTDHPSVPVGNGRESPATPVAGEERSELAKDLNSPTQDIHADLRILDEIFNAFRTNFPQSGNPIGNNAEITAVLTGKNPRHIAFIPPDHPAINAHGELCDRWGRPFFFHQLSGRQMEIRSAGPDRKFWTADDVVLTP